MAKPLFILCDAPCFRQSLDLNKLSQAIEGHGIVTKVPYVCSEGGLRAVKTLLASHKGSKCFILTGNCHAGEFLKDSFPSDLDYPPSILDLSSYESETIAAAHALFQVHQPRPRRKSTPKKIYEKAVLVIGGGVAGVQTALDLAEAEKTVYLVERAVSIGGIMSQLDKTFPTLDCSICILGPKLADVGRNPNIQLLTLTEVTDIKGEAGHFQVTLTLHPRYVDMNLCTGCGACADVCPVILPNEWDLNLKPRKCIHILFAQSIPLRSTIDMDHCIKCQLCVQACEKNAINLEDTEKMKKIQVGAIVVATGLDPFDASRRSAFGYGRFENVFTNIDFERIVCASGPTEGALIRPDGTPIKRVAFIQCVGSRDIRFNRYCSGYCCMASIKEAMLIKETVPDAEVTIFFNDLRAAGKGFEELYLRAQERGINFVKGLPSKIEEDPETRNPVLWFEEMVGDSTKVKREFDFVILAAGVEPDHQLHHLSKTLGVDRDTYGFLKERHTSWGAIETTIPGIFMAGGTQGPKDIPESVAQASGAAARALAMIHRLQTSQDPE